MARHLVLVVALLAVSAAAYPAQENGEKKEEENYHVRNGRFLSSLGISDTLTNRIQGLTDRLSNSDRGTISSLLSSLSQSLPAPRDYSYDSFLGAINQALGK